MTHFEMLGRKVTITGLGTYLPATEVANDALPAHLDTSDAWIRQRTGIQARRLAPAGAAASDLGIPAAQAALTSAGLPAERVDLVMCASISPDNLMPATAARIAHALGAVNAGGL
ncbi:MAG: hypothetical protein M1325_00410 [Actinobacteria bacterium]|nr:hypothetical protein [Actinomycetota bacterium]